MVLDFFQSKLHVYIYVRQNRVLQIGTSCVLQFSPIRPGQWWRSWTLASAPDCGKCLGNTIDLSVRMGGQAPSVTKFKFPTSPSHPAPGDVRFLQLQGQWGHSGRGRFWNRGLATHFLEWWFLTVLKPWMWILRSSLFNKVPHKTGTKLFPQIWIAQDMWCLVAKLLSPNLAFCQLQVHRVTSGVWRTDRCEKHVKESFNTIRWDHVSCSQGPSNSGQLAIPAAHFRPSHRPPRNLSSHEGLCRQAQPGSPENDCHETSLGILSPFYCKSVTKEYSNHQKI